MGDFLQQIIGVYQWVGTNKAAILAAYAATVATSSALVKALQGAVDIFPNHAKADTVFGSILRFLDSASHSPFLNLLALTPTPIHAQATAKAALVSAQKKLNLPGAVVVLFACFLASSAHAQTFSAGLSVPLLEIQPGNTHPVAFAPGAGVQANLNLFPATVGGMETDLLDISAILFANAPGAMQAALTVGTLGGLICVGVAVPLYAADGSGAFQGQAHAYPVLGGSIPFDLGSAPTPGATGAPTGGPPPPPTTVPPPPAVVVHPRLGTVYFGIL